MSDKNLLLFPKKSKPVIGMTHNEAKFMITGSLLVVLTLAVGINASLFSQGTRDVASSGGSGLSSGRSVASINPIFKVSWEKRAFEVLDHSSVTDLARVGQKPDSVEKLGFGFLKGHYHISQIDGVVKNIQIAEQNEQRALKLDQPKQFISQNMALFAKKAQRVEKLTSESKGELLVEKFALKDGQDQSLGLVQVIRDQQMRLLSMSVQ